MNSVTEAIQMATDFPGLFLLYALCAFLVTMLVVGLLAYLLMRKIAGTTALDGVMQVEINLNQWPQDRLDGQFVNLAVGRYLIGMHDPDKVTKNRLDPRLGFMDKAKTRKYSIGILLDRFAKKHEKAGFYGDASWKLLNNLLYDTDFCRDLGVCYREVSSHALNGSGLAKYQKDRTNKQKLSLYMDLPKSAAEKFLAETGCQVSNICMTMEHIRLENGK